MKDKMINSDKASNNEDGNSHAELIIVNAALAFQNEERKKRASELIIANKELAFQNKEKGKRAAELVIANKELAFQNKEKEMRASELIVANAELTFQNLEKEYLTAELMIANKELAFQNKEKGKRASELVIANKELAFQNKEKEKRAAELIIANAELIFQNQEKEKRASELAIANKELAFQNNEKEKRAEELLIVIKELESFTFISSHDLQEPLRKIQAFSNRILDEEYDNLSAKGKYYFERSMLSALRMQTLINDLLVYSRTTASERKFVKSDVNKIVKEVMASMKEEFQEKNATIEMGKLDEMNIIPFQFKQLLQNLIANSLKFSKPDIAPHIDIESNYIAYNQSNRKAFLKPVDYFQISLADNGIGFNPEYSLKIFDIFQRFHNKEEYEGTGIGLAIVKKIVENHNGIIVAKGDLNKGATFDIYIPTQQ